MDGAEATFLFTDIAGSTRLWEESPEAMRSALARHDALVRDAVQRHGGTIFKTVGDAFRAVFGSTAEAAAAALAAQRTIEHEIWETPRPIRVRMAIHTGNAQTQGNEHTGPTLNRTVRLLPLGHGGQTLLSFEAREALGGDLPAGAEIVMLAPEPEPVFGLVAQDLANEFPPLRTIQASEELGPSNLPAPTTSFVGRQAELAEVAELLRTTRILTLAGAGGTGKTRLAVRVAAEAQAAFPGGVWLVELAPLDDPALVAPTVGSVIGATGDRPLLDALVERLRIRPSLIVLDNCEHLLRASAELAQTLIRAIPTLRILVTSREPFDLAEEKVFRVSPLAQDEAIRLFIERAVAHRDDFVMTEHNASVVGSLCARLDGIPFAVELAAARVRTLSVEQIASRLDDRFRLLTQGSRAALPRQQTLRALVEWSFELLNERERTVFRRLAVFVGGWDRDGLTAVVCDGGMSETEAVRRMVSLVDKSLATVSDGRYGILESVRQYALERLRESGEEPTVLGRHAAFFGELARHEGPRCNESGEAVRRLTVDWDNLRAAMDRSNSSPRLDMAVALDTFWSAKGAFREGLERCQAVLREEGAAALDDRRWAVSKAASWFAVHLGDRAASVAWAEEGIRVAQALGDVTKEASVVASLARVFHEAGDLSRARELCEKALSLWDHEVLHLNLAKVLLDAGDYSSARTTLDRSAALAKDPPSPYHLYFLHAYRGCLAFSAGDLSGAEVEFEIARSLAADIEGTRMRLEMRIAICNVVRMQGRPEEALTVARSILGESANSTIRNDALFAQARAAYAVGEFAGAKTALIEDLRSSPPLNVLERLEFAASLLVAEKPKIAALLLGAASAARTVRPMPVPPVDRPEYDRLKSALEVALGEKLASATAEGEQIGIDAAKILAIDGLTD